MGPFARGSPRWLYSVQNRSAFCYSAELAPPPRSYHHLFEERDLIARLPVFNDATSQRRQRVEVSHCVCEEIDILHNQVLSFSLTSRTPSPRESTLVTTVRQPRRTSASNRRNRSRWVSARPRTDFCARIGKLSRPKIAHPRPPHRSKSVFSALNPLLRALS